MLTSEKRMMIGWKRWASSTNTSSRIWKKSAFRSIFIHLQHFKYWFKKKKMKTLHYFLESCSRCQVWIIDWHSWFSDEKFLEYLEFMVIINSKLKIPYMGGVLSTTKKRLKNFGFFFQNLKKYLTINFQCCSLLCIKMFITISNIFISFFFFLILSLSKAMYKWFWQK